MAQHFAPLVSSRHTLRKLALLHKVCRGSGIQISEQINREGAPSEPPWAKCERQRRQTFPGSLRGAKTVSISSLLVSVDRFC